MSSRFPTFSCYNGISETRLERQINVSQIVNPIQVGLCGWGDHDLYPAKTPAKAKLSIYTQHFPVVELDSTYHAIPSAQLMERWVNQTPENFRFVIKAYRELTGHGRGKGAPERSRQEVIDQYIKALEPMKKAKKYSMLLFQFPPWYDCTKTHVKYIRHLRDLFHQYTMAIEFRHQSWFQNANRAHTLNFLEEEHFVHVICDEPQAGEGSVPIVPAVTHPEHALIRFHGRNVAGWNDTGNPNWRKVRYAYAYQTAELVEWQRIIEELKKQTSQVTLLFNNNSQGDALASARKMMDLLSLDFQGLSPRQMNLF